MKVRKTTSYHRTKGDKRYKRFFFFNKMFKLQSREIQGKSTSFKVALINKKSRKFESQNRIIEGVFFFLVELLTFILTTAKTYKKKIYRNRFSIHE